MKITYTKNTLEKLENLFKELGYQLRMEKGNFKTGTCIISQDKVVVINKFSNLESKINALITLIQSTNPDTTQIWADEKQKLWYYQLQQKKLEL